MLKQLISQYGKEKINSLTKYPSILTLHAFGEHGRLTDQLTTSILPDEMYATEKIDGTNVRIICFGAEYLIGSREFILHHSEDLYFDPAQGIVNDIHDLQIKIPKTDQLTIIYGELFGGKITNKSKNYGQEKVGFRVFDCVVVEDLSILESDIKEISNWREHDTENGLHYGQTYLSKEKIIKQFPNLQLVPEVVFKPTDLTHQSILQALETSLPQTIVALTPSALLKAEGVILRNTDRTKIVKLRFEDYIRTLKSSK